MERESATCLFADLDVDPVCRMAVDPARAAGLLKCFVSAPGQFTAGNAVGAAADRPRSTTTRS